MKRLIAISLLLAAPALAQDKPAIAPGDFATVNACYSGCLTDYIRQGMRISTLVNEFCRDKKNVIRAFQFCLAGCDDVRKAYGNPDLALRRLLKTDLAEIVEHHEAKDACDEPREALDDLTFDH